jgi:beta-mannosidase
MAREVLGLGGQWEFREYPPDARRMRDLDEQEWMSAQVPSSIYTCLVDAGRIDHKRLNTDPEDFIDVSEKAWIFRKTFDAPEGLLECRRVDLVFEGLDTVTQIWFNDKLVARTDNMFIEHRFDVSDLIKKTGNRLLVKFNSPIEHAERLMNRYGKLSELYFGYPCRSYIRKAQYQFGWDWCPPLPGCGIWRPVRLEGVDEARIEDLHVRTIDCNDSYADIAAALSIDTAGRRKNREDCGSPYPLKCVLRIADVAEVELEFHPSHDRQSTIVRIENPSLWWPRGYGEQHLYRITAELAAADRVIDTMTTEFGIRTAHLVRTKDKYGESFGFEINGQSVYARGANWIPLTMFPGSQTLQDYEHLLNKAAEANFNMLRVWGGGCYENREFYELCDRLGIMVWQDFMFACAYYPDRKWFFDAVRTEAAAVIKRLRNHASIVIWCGNNEIEWAHAKGEFGKGRKLYGRDIWEKLLRQLTSELDSQRDYIATTPFSGSSDMNSPVDGTIHQWDVWSGHQSARTLTSEKEPVARFVSEFGFQALPAKQTIETFCSGDELRIAGRTIEKHNYQLDGNSRLFRYLTDIFAPPGSLDDFVYLSQLTQAREIRRFVEYLRAHNHINRGVMFWQFDDCCPAISWSAVDYLKRPKALYYYARRFFAPVLVTLVNASESSRPDLHPCWGSASIVVINDSPQPLTATVRCRLMDVDGQVRDAASFPAAVAPHTHSSFIKLPQAIRQPDKPERSVIVLTVENETETIARNVFTTLPDKYMAWPATNIKTVFEQVADKAWDATFISGAAARDVQVISSASMTLSDNYFDLIGGEEHKVRIEFSEQIMDPRTTLRYRSVGSVCTS